MPLTDYQKRWIVQQSGFDPEQYTADETTQTVVPIVRTQPAVNVSPYTPKLETPDNLNAQQQQKTSALGAAGLGFAHNTLPTILGGAGAGLVTSELNPLAHMAPPYSEIGFGLAGALAGGFAGRGIQQAIEPQSFQQQVAQSQQEHPIASAAGSIATMPLGGFSPNSLANLKTAGLAIPKLLTPGLALTANEATQLANVGIGAGLPVATDVASSIIGGQGMPSVKDLLLNAALGGVFSKPNAIGKMFGFHDAVPEQFEFTKEMLARSNKQQESKPLEFSQAEPNKEQLLRQQIIQQGLVSGNLPSAEARSNKMAKYAESQQPTAEELARLEGEGGQSKTEEKSPGEILADQLIAQHEARLEQAKLRKEDFKKAKTEEALQSGVSIGQLNISEKTARPLITTELGKEIYPDYTGVTEHDIGINKQESAEDFANRKLEGYKDKYQQQSNIATEQEKQTADELQRRGFTGNLTQAWFNLSARLAGKRGAKLAITKDINTAGATRIPELRNTLQQIVAKINPEKAGTDTPTHELLHIFINDLRNSKRARDQQFVSNYDRLVAEHPDYQKWSAERSKAGMDSSPEEYQATNQGVESINRALSNETPFQQWKNDFSSYLKTRWSKHATTEDFQRIMNYKLLHDPAYYKIVGGVKSSSVGNTLKQQDESNLIDPKQDAIKTNINNGLQAAEDKSLDLDQLKELQTALANQVNWKQGSKVKESLLSKDFDPDDPSHWQQLRNLYNGEYYQAEQKSEPEKQSVEVPRTIPAEGQEANKPQVKPVKLAKEQSVELKDISGKQITSIADAGYKLKDIPERITKAEPKTYEQQKQDTLSSKMAWDAIDNTTNPQAAMDLLKEQYDHAYLKEQRARQVGDREEANKMADLRTAHLMRMHYLADKKGLSVPDVGRLQLQEESNLKEMPADKAARILLHSNSSYYDDEVPLLNKASENIKNKWNQSIPPSEIEYILGNKEIGHPWLRKAIGDLNANELIELHNKVLVNEKTNKVLGEADNPTTWNQEQSNIKLPNLHNRVSEFGKEEDKLPLGYSKFPGFTAQLDKVKQLPEGGKEMAKAFEEFVPLKDELYGRYISPILKAVKGLSKSDTNKIENVMIMENREKKSYRDLLNAKQQNLYDAIRTSLRAKQEEQIAANQPVTEASGEKRLPKIDPYYYPNKISPKVAEQLTEHPLSAETKRLKNDFIQHQLQYGNSKKQAEEKLATILTAYDKGQPNIVKFGAVRKAEGIGLPDSWMRNNLEKNLSGYFNRVAADRAYHDTFETNPDVMKVTEGKTTDPWDKPFEQQSTLPTESIAGNGDVKDILHRIHGEPFSKDEATLKSIQRVATSLFLGPLTNFHIAASSVANSFQYQHPIESVGNVIRALSNLKEGYEKAVSTGSIRPNLSTLKDVWDINNTQLEKWRAGADIIGRYNGRDLTNAVTKAYLQNIGELIVKSKSLQANAGNKAAIDIMNRVDPNWSPGKTYTENEITNLSSNFGSIIHGAHDARTLPGWMLKDSAIQPFLSLMSWNISQTNAWMRHVWTPAVRDGNFVPLIMSSLGAGIGGYIVKEGREKLADKKSPIPSLTEIANSSRGVEGNIPLVAYNLMAMSSYTGYAGILSVIGKGVEDIAHKNIPQSATFPLDEVLGNSTHRISQFASAMMNDPNMDYVQSGIKLATDLAKENIQLARIGISWAANAGALDQEHYSKELNKKIQDLRRFEMVEGIPYEEQAISGSNPYLSSKMKAFKRTQDIGEAVGALPNLIEAAFKKASGDPEVLRNELHKIRQNSYQTMPDPDRMPYRFIKYMTWLGRTEGQDVATQRYLDYVQHKAINEVKGEMVPSL